MFKTFGKRALGALGALSLVAIAAASLAWAQGVTFIPFLQGTEQFVLNYPCTVSCVATTNVVVGATRSSPGFSGLPNLIVGGDYTTNPFQRGTSNGSAHIANTLTYGPADQWFIGAAGSSIDWSQNTSSAPPKYSASLTMQRTSGNTDVNPICLGQASTSVESVRFAGNQAMLEIWAQAGSNYSGGAVTATIAVGTGTDQSAASFAAGTWANYTATASAPLTSLSSIPAVASQLSLLSTNSFTPTTTWTRYVMAFTVPASISAANVNQLGTKLCWTPSGTAGANDYVNFAAWQVEVNNTGVPSSFEHLAQSLSFVRAAKFFQAINEPAAGINVAVGVAATTTTCQLVIPLVDQMRVAPSVSFSGTALSTSTWKIQDSTTSTLANPFLAAGSGNTAAVANLTATLTTATTAGFACALQGNGAGGKIWLSAEL